MPQFLQTFRLEGEEGDFAIGTETDSVREGQVELGRAYFGMTGRVDTIYKAVRRDHSLRRISCINLDERERCRLARQPTQPQTGQTLSLFTPETGGTS